MKHFLRRSSFVLRRSSFVVRLSSFVLVLGIAAWIFPTAASAWFRNQANAQIARAVAFKDVSALNQADAHLVQAEAWSRDALIEFARARASLARDDAPRAVAAMSATGEALRDDSIAQFVWAEAEWRLGNASAAFEHWRAAGALTFFVNAMHRAQFAHQWDEAARLARIALGIAPDNVEAQYVLGDVLGYVDTEAALRELARAEELTRDNELLATILSRQGEILAARGESAAALALFEQAMQIAPRDARPRTDAARVLFATQPGARERAVALLHEALAVAPWYIAAYITLAEIAEADGDVRTAEDWYAKGLAQNRNNPDLLFARAKFYARQNRLEQAKADLILAMQNETRADERAKIARELEALNAR